VTQNKKINRNILRSSITVSRNISGHKFVPSMDPAESVECINAVSNALRYVDKRFYPIKYEERNMSEYLYLYEKSLTSLPEKEKKQHSAVFVREDDNLSVQVNHTEHIVIHAVNDPLDFDTSFSDAYSMERILQHFFPFCFSTGRGYLMSRPEFSGTGLTASVLLHLPATVRTNRTGIAYKLSRELKMVLKPAFPEKKALPAFFILENTNIKGVSEEDTVGLIYDACKELCSMEEQAQADDLSDNNLVIKTQAEKSFNTLKNVDSISENIFINMMSLIRYAAESGIFSRLNCNQIDKLLFSSMNGGVLSGRNHTDKADDADHLRSISIKRFIGQEDDLSC